MKQMFASVKPKKDFNLAEHIPKRSLEATSKLTSILLAQTNAKISEIKTVDYSGPLAGTPPSKKIELMSLTKEFTTSIKPRELSEVAISSNDQRKEA